MEKTIDCRLGKLTIKQTNPEPEMLETIATLDSTEPKLCGFIQTQTMEYTNDLDKDYDVHRTGIKLQPFFQVDDVPLSSLGYPANLFTRLEPMDEDYAKLRLTIKAFLVDIMEDGAFQYVTGFSWGYERMEDWQALPIEELSQADWVDAMARLNYESPTFEYRA